MHQSNRLLLLPPSPEQFDRFYEIHADPQTNLFNPNGPMNKETAVRVFNEMQLHWQTQGFGSWCIAEKEHPEMVIGFGGLADRLYGNEIKLNLGYRFDKNYWGKGYATELALSAIAFGFGELQKKEIFALVRPAHAASIRVLEKCGMQFYSLLHDVADGPPSRVYIITP